MSEAPLPGESIDVGVACVQGKVVLKWEHPTNLIVFDPTNASTVAEHMARAAFEAYTGKVARDDISHLHAQVKNCVTEQMRSLLMRRLEIMLNSMREDKQWSNARLATELLDTVLTKVA